MGHHQATREACALSIAAGDTLKAAAELNLVAYSTLREWYSRDAEFQSMVRALRAELTDRALGRLADYRAEAAEIAMGIARMDDDPDRQLRATAVILRESRFSHRDTDDADADPLAERERAMILTWLASPELAPEAKPARAPRKAPAKRAPAKAPAKAKAPPAKRKAPAKRTPKAKP